jgi:hypothetical protein
MREITRVGADLAKSVIQIHSVYMTGKIVTNRRLARDKIHGLVRPVASALSDRHGGQLQCKLLGAQAACRGVVKSQSLWHHEEKRTSIRTTRTHRRGGTL